MSKETKHHRSENGPQGPPSVDTSAMVGTPSNALYKSVPNRIPEVEIISSNCSKPSPLSSNRTSKAGSPVSALTASRRSVTALAIPQELSSPAASKVSANFLISVPFSVLVRFSPPHWIMQNDTCGAGLHLKQGLINETVSHFDFEPRGSVTIFDGCHSSYRVLSPAFVTAAATTGYCYRHRLGDE